MSYSTIPKLLTLAINSNVEANAVLAGRVHYQYVPQKSVYPHIYFERSGRDTEDLLSGGDGIVIERYTLELATTNFDGDLCDVIQSTLENLECTYEGTTVHCVELEDVDANYVFKSADSDALFLHGFRIAVYSSIE